MKEKLRYKKIKVKEKNYRKTKKRRLKRVLHCENSYACLIDMSVANFFEDYWITYDLCGFRLKGDFKP